MTEETFVKITNQNVYEKLLEMEKVQNHILEHSKLTNGRVSKLEARSIGMWVAQHPYKFAVYTVVILSFLVSDIRHPVLNLVASFFGI